MAEIVPFGSTEESVVDLESTLVSVKRQANTAGGCGAYTLVRSWAMV